MKLLLTESMIIYNVAQVFLNGWMVYEMIHAVLNKGHPFIGSRSIVGVAVESGASYAVWVHYCDKYLEFFDTYFMVLRGKMDQVRTIYDCCICLYYTIVRRSFGICIAFVGVLLMSLESIIFNFSGHHGLLL